MDVAQSGYFTFNLDISKWIECEEIITVGSIVKLDKPLFPAIRFVTVDACQRVVTRKKTASLHIRSIIAVRSRTTTMSQFPFHGLTIILCLNYYIFTHYHWNRNSDSSSSLTHLIYIYMYVYICLNHFDLVFGRWISYSHFL